MKNALTTAPVLSLIYNVSKSTRLCTDASQQGLDFILQQQSNGTTINVIQAGSNFLTDMESRYVTITLEMLEICWSATFF